MSQALAAADFWQGRGSHPLARRRNLGALLAWLPLVVLVGLRGDTRDTVNYIDVFRQVDAFPWNPVEFYADYGMEWGYGLASWLLGGLGLGPTALFLLVSLATFYFLGRAALNVGLGPLEVAPFYLGSYFLLQQLMQIRQGLGAAFALWLVTLIANDRRPAWKAIAGLLAGVLIHLTTVLPVLGALLLRLAMPRATRMRVLLWSAGLAGLAVVLARAFMSFDVIAELGRLAVYAREEEYGGERGLLAPANVRAALVLAVLLLAPPPALLRSRAYVLMTGLYAAHLGIRLGFFDFLILSGRLATALGFVEVLLLPMLLRSRVHSPALRWAVGLAYLLLQAAATLSVQAPFLIDDYLTPLHADRSAA